MINDRRRSHEFAASEQIGWLLRAAIQRHTVIFTSQMTDDVTQTQFASLAKLYELGPCSQNQLGRLIFLDSATIKGVIDRLRAKGLITTTDDNRDNRRHAVVLTKEGRRVTEAAIKVVLKITRDTLMPLSEEERKTVASLLKKLI